MPPLFSPIQLDASVSQFLFRLGAIALLLLALGAASHAQPASDTVSHIELTPMPFARRVHGSAVLNDWLYVFGGRLHPTEATDVPRNAANTTTNVQRARIGADNTLGPWEDDRPLPSPRSFIGNSTISFDLNVFIVGGTDGLEDVQQVGIKHKTVLCSRLGADDRLAPWVESAPFPGPGLSCFAATSVSGFLYIVGGNTEQLAPTGNVIVGRLDSEGHIADWEQGEPLPTPLWFHSATVAAGRLWVWGGLTGPTSKSASDKVYSARILASGRLASWQRETPDLPIGLYRGAKTNAGPYLLCFSPSYPGGKLSNDVVFAATDADGHMVWAGQRTAISSMNFLAAATDYRRDSIYVSGGSRSSGINAETGVSSVSLFRLSPAAEEEQQQPPQAPSTSITDVPRPFTAYEQLRASMTNAFPRPVVLYFSAANSKRSASQWDALNRGEALLPLTGLAQFAWVDVEDSPQTGQQFGVSRVPTWIVYDLKGTEVQRFVRPVTPEDLREALVADGG